MTAPRFAAALALAALLAGGLTPAPAGAEHGGRPWVDLDLGLDLEVGADGFRLGGRVLGPQGPYGAWLEGWRSPWGFRLDGRVEDGARRYRFRLDTDAWRWWWERGDRGSWL